MNRSYLRSVLALLLVFTLLWTGCSQSAKTPSDPETFTLNDAYVLVRFDELSADGHSAFSLLSRGLKSAYGCSFAETSDSDDTAHEYEILVGETSRAASQSIAKELTYYDWTYKIVSPQIILITGGSDAATLTAVQAFLKDVVGYEEDQKTQKVLSAGSPVPLAVGTEVSYRHTYDVASLKIGEHDLSEYTMVTTSPAAYTIVDFFNRLTGIKISVVPPEEYVTGPAIFFGCADADGSHLPYTVYSAVRYYIQDVDSGIAIDFKTKGVAADAAERFIFECTARTATGASALSFRGDGIATGISIPEGTNALRLDSSIKAEIVNGVTYEENLYLDADQKPVRAYVLTVESGAATFATSTPDDVPSIGKLSGIPKQAAAAAANGKNVIAAINGNFYAVDGTNEMHGLCIKDGTVLHEVGHYPWFGVTKDGQAVIGHAADYEALADSLITAAAGSHIVLKNDHAFQIGTNDTYGSTRHPRTAIGIKPNGDVVLLVVDGRQPAFSNGASLADLAYLLASLGCVEGINLDGGGSSTFVLKEKDGTLSVKNSPSDGAPRPVLNGITVILP